MGRVTPRGGQILPTLPTENGRVKLCLVVGSFVRLGHMQNRIPLGCSPGWVGLSVIIKQISVQSIEIEF